MTQFVKRKKSDEVNKKKWSFCSKDLPVGEKIRLELQTKKCRFGFYNAEAGECQQGVVFLGSKGESTYLNPPCTDTKDVRVHAYTVGCFTKRCF